MESQKDVFKIGEDWLTSGKAIQLAEGILAMTLTDATEQKINKSSQVVKQIVEKGQPVYGINTGFGPLCTTKISSICLICRLNPGWEMKSFSAAFLKCNSSATAKK